MSKPMRVRFAPSPTGALHIGGARTALFNWLLARGSGGVLVLRIEDTDRERSTPENVQQILDALQWLQLDWDEGPFFQTERAERHREVLERLLADGYAYRSTATAEDVKEYKLRHGAERGFRGDERGGGQTEGAVRLRVPDEGATVVYDVIRGDTRFEHIHLDDPVIARSDGSVLYNFAVAVDDLDAGITHVVRGEDHLSNTPKQLLVLEAAKAAGIEPDAVLPLYAHLPLLHGPDGKKLSKRHGAASVQELRSGGYLPEAVRNYLALLGWGSGDDTTILTTEQLVERFALERVSRNPAQFDEAKLRWMNGVYIRELTSAELAGRLAGYLATEDTAHASLVGMPESGTVPRESGTTPSEGRERSASDERLRRAAEISQEKIQVLSEFWPLAGLFFEPPAAIDQKAADRWLDEKGRHTLAETLIQLQQLTTFDQPAVESALLDVQNRLELKPRDVYQPLRVAVSGTTISPGIFETVTLLGREETLLRIDAALEPTN